MYKIGVIGTGYVGLVTGACLSDFGLSVICNDLNEDKIQGLNNGVMPIYEAGLEAIVERNTYYKRLYFTSDIIKTVQDSDVIFVAVGTPSSEDGSADLTYVKAVIDSIVEHMNEYKVIVTKSTVPIGTGQKVKSGFEVD